MPFMQSTHCRNKTNLFFFIAVLLQFILSFLYGCKNFHAANVSNTGKQKDIFFIHVFLLLLHLAISMSDNKATFLTAVEHSLKDKDLRKKISSAAETHRNAFEEGKKQYAHLEIARQRAAFAKWKAIENL